MKRLIASLAVGGTMLGGAVAVPLVLTAQAASAAPVKAHEKASPNLPVKAQQALIRNGSWDHVAAESCTIYFTPSGPSSESRDRWVRRTCGPARSALRDANDRRAS